MAKNDDSKEKTVAAAAKLLAQRGYYGTALQDILEASGAPRGSLYFHFPKGKEEIGEAAMARGAITVRRFIAQTAQISDSAESFLVQLVRGMSDQLVESDYREGCPLATTALETAAQSATLAIAAREAFRSWEQEIGRGLQRFGMQTEDAERAATSILSQLEGALLLARTYRNLEPMRRAEIAVLLIVGNKVPNHELDRRPRRTRQR
jgi:TetR/AcrR family transcriptional regulator, lmrAB and yxaGH operons repressor